MKYQWQSLLLSFKARLSRRIVWWVLASIVAIEIVILIPSYLRRKEELLLQIERISGATFMSLAQLKNYESLEVIFLDKVKQMTLDSMILGGAIYRANGQLIGTFGEIPDITFAEVQKNEKIRLLNQDGTRYDAAWSPRQLGCNYIVIARHDSSFVKQDLQNFIFRISGLVLLISVFVTFVTMLVLGGTVIAPILRLRDDLIAAGDALSKDEKQVEFYSGSVKRDDELGDVMIAFNQMFTRIYTEIEKRKQTEVILRSEQEKSERLLLNILPQLIADKLKEGQNNIADEFAEVTILFADIVGFTHLSSLTSPEHLVELLNEIFSTFDQLTEKHGLEKIKTIGDAYMVVGGLPTPRRDHAKAIANMALDMLAEIAQFNQKYAAALSIRIGINTGPVVAGVIGTKKFSYDLWGDAVNTASRMESHGIPGAIQVTPETYERLRDEYWLEPRGMIQIKGKGEMETYFLIARKKNLVDS